MKQKMNLRQELDLTRDGTAEMTRWCIIIALHQCFGVGKDRLNRIELRAEELGLESLNIAMQANGKGMPSTDQSRAMRDNWMPEGVEPEFRVPVLRAPRTRREQQLRMAGDVAASMVWTLYAKACMELLGYGAGRLNRLKQEALANYRQVNEEGRADGLDVAMEHLRRCACDALQTDDIIVEDIPDEERAKQADRDYEEQKDAFFRRNMAGAMGRCAAPAGTAVLAPGEIKKKIEAVLQQAAAPESWERRRLCPPEEEKGKAEKVAAGTGRKAAKAESRTGPQDRHPDAGGMVLQHV